MDYHHYYVNKNAQDTGEHEVHKEECWKLPEPKNRQYLGYFSSCEEAVEKAKDFFDDVDGCKLCSEECHTK